MKIIKIINFQITNYRKKRNLRTVALKNLQKRRIFNLKNQIVHMLC